MWFLSWWARRVRNPLVAVYFLESEEQAQVVHRARDKEGGKAESALLLAAAMLLVLWWWTTATWNW